MLALSAKVFPKAPVLHSMMSHSSPGADGMEDRVKIEAPGNLYSNFTVDCLVIGQILSNLTW